MNGDRAPRSVRFNRLLVMTLVLAGVAAAPTLAADSIYLKNGRVIRTSSAEIVGDRVMFTQFGHPIAIPMSEVDRIVDDDYEDPVATPSAAQPEAATPMPSAAGRPAGGGVPGAPHLPVAAGAAVDTPSATDPEQTKDYWQDRVRSIHADGELLALQMQDVRRIERAFLFSHRSTADIRRRKERLQARIDANAAAFPALRTEARRRKIPPGWLRLPSGG